MNLPDDTLQDSTMERHLHGRNIAELGRDSAMGQMTSWFRRILITGGAGFIGSVLVKKLAWNYPEYELIVVDKLDYCSSINNLRPLLDATILSGEGTPSSSNAPTTATTTTTTTGRGRVEFLQGDITDQVFVESVMDKYQIDTVIHLAAQTHVDKSFGESIEFTRNNVLGTHIMLEAARRRFCLPRTLGTRSKEEIEAGSISEMKVQPRFVYVSTDEVYGEVPFGEPDCLEEAPLAPTNPYSATKAAAECMVQAYYKSFQLPVLITRSNNVYGPFQYPEKIFPKFIMSLLSAPSTCPQSLAHPPPRLQSQDQAVPAGTDHGAGYCYIHGTGHHSRTYLYVADVANAIDVILHRGQIGQVYNIGGGQERNNLELAQDLIHRIVPGLLSAKDAGSGPRQELSLLMQLESSITTTTTTTSQTLDSGSGTFIPPPPRLIPGQDHLRTCDTCDARIVFVEDRAFNDVRYAVDSSKLIQMGWEPRVSLDQGISQTIEWYRKYGQEWWGDIHQALYPHSVRSPQA